MISSTRSSRDGVHRRACTDRGARPGRARRCPRRAASASARRSRRSASGCARLRRVALRRRRSGSSPATARARSRIRSSSGSPTTVSFATTSTFASPPSPRARSTTTCSTGQARRPPCGSARRRCARSQPDRCSRVRRDDDLVDRRLELGERVAHRVDRVGLDDEAVRGDARLAQQRRASGRAAGRPRRGACPRRRRSPRAAGSPGQIDGHAATSACLRAPLERLDAASAPATVSFATTRTCAQSAAGTSSRLDAAPVAVQHRVPRAGDAVLVRAADDLRDLVEVEDRRRRGDLPLERQRAPRVRRARSGRAPSS